MSGIVYNLYLSTTSITNPPVDKSNLGRVTWNVDWHALFGDAKGLAKVSIDMRSNERAVVSADDVKGTVRASQLGGPYQTSSNGFIMGRVNCVADSIAAGYGYYVADTTGSNALPITSIPNWGQGQLTISVLGDDESTINTGIPDWDIVLSFIML